MIVEETVIVRKDVPVAPCVKCRGRDITIHDLGYSTFNKGGGTCTSCKHEVLETCGPYSPSKVDLISIWNRHNDIATLIAEQQAIIDKAQATINDLLFQEGNQEKVYLAGPDVFRPDAIGQGEYLKELCAQHGMKGMYPFDNSIPAGLTGSDAAKVISQANMDMIRSSTAVLINLANFRGKEPDSGTAYEFGMAVAQGKKVWAYFKPEGTLLDQIAHDASGVDENGFHVEDFGLPRNLMLACTWIGASDTPEEAAFNLAKSRAAKDV